MKLIKGGPVHSKFLRMIHVQVNICAPLYWWKQFDTYKVGTTANSSSTMHTIDRRPLSMDDFSTDYLNGRSEAAMQQLVDSINTDRSLFKKTEDRSYWYSMIGSLPTSFNQFRTIDLSYETLRNIYYWRKDHHLDEWKTFCLMFIPRLPYSEFITEDFRVTCKTCVHRKDVGNGQIVCGGNSGHGMSGILKPTDSCSYGEKEQKGGSHG